MRGSYPGGRLRPVGIARPARPAVLPFRESGDLHAGFRRSDRVGRTVRAEFGARSARFGYAKGRVYGRALGRTRSPADETASATPRAYPSVGASHAPPERRTAEDEVDAVTWTSDTRRRSCGRQGTPVRTRCNRCAARSRSTPLEDDEEDSFPTRRDAAGRRLR